MLRWFAQVSMCVCMYVCVRVCVSLCLSVSLHGLCLCCVRNEVAVAACLTGLGHAPGWKKPGGNDPAAWWRIRSLAPWLCATCEVLYMKHSIYNILESIHNILDYIMFYINLSFLNIADFFERETEDCKISIDKLCHGIQTDSDGFWTRTPPQFRLQSRVAIVSICAYGETEPVRVIGTENHQLLGQKWEVLVNWRAWHGMHKHLKLSCNLVSSCAILCFP